MSAPRFRLVHLDADGTLLDTREDLAASTNHVRRTFGLPPLDPLRIYGLVGHGAGVLVARALGAERGELHEDGLRCFLEHYGEHCLDTTRAYLGMVELIDRCAPLGVRFSVVTNKPEALTLKILGGLDLTSRFVAIVGGDTFPERKPHPRGVEHVRALCHAERAETLMVGDSPVDVETARAAGITCSGVLWGLDPEGVRRARPQFLAADATDLERSILEGSL